MPQYNNINWNRFVILNTPIALRTIKLVKYIIVFFEGIKLTYNEFRVFRIRQLYESGINGQVIFLEKVLNDVFDPIDRRIFITDGQYYSPAVFYEEYKNDPVIFPAEGDVLDPVFYSITTAGDRISFNFFVHVPAAIFFEKQRIRAVTNKYRIFGRTFEIILIP